MQHCIVVAGSILVLVEVQEQISASVMTFSALSDPAHALYIVRGILKRYGDVEDMDLRRRSDVYDSGCT